MDNYQIVSMRIEPWRAELLQEQASPPLAASFTESAKRLAKTLSPESLDSLERVYVNPGHSISPDVQPVARLIADAGLLLSPQSAMNLLAYAVDEHRDPFLAIAAQALQFGDTEDQLLAVEILGDLAERAKFAEAAAILSSFREHLPQLEVTSTYWQEYAENLWPASVRGIRGQLTRVSAFGSYYTAHLLAARRGAWGG